MTTEFVSKSIEEVSSCLRKREISPLDLLEAYLTQIDSYNGRVNAYIDVTKEKARIAAQKAEKELASGNYRGMLHGVPIALKDNIYIKGEKTTIGSKIHQSFVPDDDATVVKKLKEAGAIIIGKLNLHEYAVGITNNNPHYGPCRNPWDLRRISGGSSGGSGAAVSAEMACATLGTDTGGSVRIPASACGVIGLKPSYGRVSKYGCFPLAWSLDHIGPITKTVRDSAILLDILSGYDEKDPTSIKAPDGKFFNSINGDITGLKIGINDHYFFHNVDPLVDKKVREGIQQLVEMGAVVEHVQIPHLNDQKHAQFVTITSEASTIHQHNLKSKTNDFGEDVRLFLKLGETHSAVDYLQAQETRRLISLDFAEIFNKVDVLVTPTLPFMPPEIGEDQIERNGKKVDLIEHMVRFTNPANATGLPAISIPCGIIDGMPVGMQIIGPAFKENVILNVAYAFEQTNPLRGKKPNLT